MSVLWVYGECVVGVWCVVGVCLWVWVDLCTCSVKTDIFFSVLRIAPCDFKPGKSDGLVHCSVKNAAVLCENHRERVTQICSSPSEEEEEELYDKSMVVSAAMEVCSRPCRTFCQHQPGPKVGPMSQGVFVQATDPTCKTTCLPSTPTNL